MPNQFGFKKGHSTEMCIYVLKEMIEFYKSCNTSVFVTFLDASKAYDKIDHWLLYDKLLHNDVPIFIVKILVYWYSHQEMFIRWGNSCSNKFYVTNGVKQGGILSPALFNVYMNNLSVTLNQSGIGGFLGDSLINHICYAATYVLLHLVHLGCNFSWICVACMLLTINYLTMQRNHFLYVLNQIELKLNHQTLHWEKKLFHL